MRVPYSWHKIRGRELHKFAFTDADLPSLDALEELKRLVDEGTVGAVYAKYSTSYKKVWINNRTPWHEKVLSAALLVEDDTDAVLFKMKFPPKVYRGKRVWSKSHNPMSA